MPEFAIHELALGGGTLALSPVPRGPAALATIAAWGADAVLSMTPEAEMAALGVGTLPEDLAALGISWLHLPVVDFGAPEGAGDWPEISATLRRILKGAGKVLIHCRGGCGRSGMAALRLMIEAGEDRDGALVRLRAVRPCAIETEAQLLWAVALP